MWKDDFEEEVRNGVSVFFRFSGVELVRTPFFHGCMGRELQASTACLGCRLWLPMVPRVPGLQVVGLGNSGFRDNRVWVG